MLKIVKNSLLNYISSTFETEKIVNSNRIFDFNNQKIRDGIIVYLIEREIRIQDNFALKFAIEKSKELNKNLKIICPKSTYDTELKNKFIENKINEAKDNFLKNNLDFEIVPQNDEGILKYLEKIKPSFLIIDFNPILDRTYLKNANFKIYEIDGHNIIPARYLSDKQEYNAASIRRKIYTEISPFLTEFKNEFTFNSEAENILDNFINNKLQYYAEFKNNPTKNVQSGLSKYLNLGFISSQKVALSVIKSNASDENKEAFLEELVIRKELADNFCLYCKNYKSFNCIPTWTKNSLNQHRQDFRQYIYSKKEFEEAKTHDNLWNAAEIQLLEEGIMQGYLRMYWAKKILEWSKTPDEALKIAIYLNDKYALDAPSPDGYTGILWSIGALHDRPFQDRPVTGKIRIMTYNSMKSKYDINSYINKYIQN